MEKLDAGNRDSFHRRLDAGAILGSASEPKAIENKGNIVVAIYAFLQYNGYMSQTLRQIENAANWKVWEIEYFLRSVATRIADGSAKLRIKESYTYNDSNEESSRWQAEDFINALVDARPWCTANPVPAMDSIEVIK